MTGAGPVRTLWPRERRAAVLNVRLTPGELVRLVDEAQNAGYPTLSAYAREKLAAPSHGPAMGAVRVYSGELDEEV